MRLIDGDAIEEILMGAISMQEKLSSALGLEKDEFVQGELKAWDILEGVKAQPTVNLLQMGCELKNE